MTAFIEKIILRFGLILAIGGIGIFASAAEDSRTYEILTFFNFADDPINVYRLDDNMKVQDYFTLFPFKDREVKTVSGTVYSYDWGNTEVATKVNSMSGKSISDRNFDWNIKPQVHMLGDLGFPEEQYEQMVRQDKLRPKIISKRLRCGTTKGDFRIEIKPFWAPRGAMRFLQMVESGHFNHNAIHYKNEDTMRFGINSDYSNRFLQSIPDDPFFVPPIEYKAGYMAFTGDGTNSRSDEVFIGMPGDMLETWGQDMEKTWETPFGHVDDRDFETLVLWQWYEGLGMNADGKAPDKHRIYEKDGYKYLEKEYPDIDYIKGCVIIPDSEADTYQGNILEYDELVDFIDKVRTKAAKKKVASAI